MPQSQPRPSAKQLVHRFIKRESPPAEPHPISGPEDVETHPLCVKLRDDIEKAYQKLGRIPSRH